jgi:hypothetical protein
MTAEAAEIARNGGGNGDGSSPTGKTRLPQPTDAGFATLLRPSQGFGAAGTRLLTQQKRGRIAHIADGGRQRKVIWEMSVQTKDNHPDLTGKDTLRRTSRRVFFLSDKDLRRSRSGSNNGQGQLD